MSGPSAPAPPKNEPCSPQKGERPAPQPSRAAAEAFCCRRLQKVTFNEPDISATQNNPFKRKVRNNCYFLFFFPLRYIAIMILHNRLNKVLL